ncbi:MAG: hypothetical protein JRJ15_11520, partial [Deltaproteobacteria bacterium]|nr:hypothetical protein [Deltaproteobacteria bacterium]
FLDTTKAQPMTGAIKTLGEAAPQEFQGYGAVIKSAIDILWTFQKRPPRSDNPGMFVIKLNCYLISLSWFYPVHPVYPVKKGGKKWGRNLTLSP